MTDNLCSPAAPEPGGLEFPLKYDLKVIYHELARADEHWRGLAELLALLNVPFGEHRRRPSGEGRYVSITVPVEILDRPVFDTLYASLKTLPGVKCAI